MRNDNDNSALFTELTSNSQLRVWEAAKQVGDDTSLIPMLVRQLKEGKKPLHRAAAAYALGCMRSKRAVPALEAALQDKNEKPSVRGHCAEALAYLCSSRSILTLTRCLKDQNREVRFWCAFALGVAGTLDRRKALVAVRALRALERDNRTVEHWWSVGDEARWAIANILGRKAEAKKLKRRIEQEAEVRRQKARRRMQR